MANEIQCSNNPERLSSKVVAGLAEAGTYPGPAAPATTGLAKSPDNLSCLSPEKKVAIDPDDGLSVLVVAGLAEAGPCPGPTAPAKTMGSIRCQASVAELRPPTNLFLGGSSSRETEIDFCLAENNQFWPATAIQLISGRESHLK
jgi:hypothetical protein